VSVDTFESSTTGYVAQLKGSLTNKRYKVATVFIDHYSDSPFMYPQEDNSSAKLIKAKIAFEQFAQSCRVKIMHYHADKGRFTENAFIKDVQEHWQSISYCGVNAHHQNGKAEKRIRDLQVQGRVMLIHAMHQWNEASSSTVMAIGYQNGERDHKYNTQVKRWKSASIPFRKLQ